MGRVGEHGRDRQGQREIHRTQNSLSVRNCLFCVVCLFYSLSKSSMYMNVPTAL